MAGPGEEHDRTCPEWSTTPVNSMIVQPAATEKHTTLKTHIIAWLFNPTQHEHTTINAQILNRDESSFRIHPLMNLYTYTIHQPNFVPLNPSKKEPG